MAAVRTSAGAGIRLWCAADDKFVPAPALHDACAHAVQLILHVRRVHPCSLPSCLLLYLLLLNCPGSNLEV